MKVLFAVSSESISEAIIKKYQKEYKEIISYKNVYYFNAVLKEIQKDKSYDRIVITEDLEPFSSNNYDQIDKTIFDKLDNISDEAQDLDGNDTTIILICTDRRTKGCSFLVKLFGIGIYNALLGEDRSMEKVCKLINKPRAKKEAKQYYKIDADDVNYSKESDKEVSELEIQNILNHFKKLGKSTSKYTESFNSIVAQYTDPQLKIIINCLPINVKAVLEEECLKYQELMSVGGIMKKVSKEVKAKEIQKNTGLKIDLIESKKNETKMNGPIVIPSSVKTSTNKNPVAAKKKSGSAIEIPSTKSENVKVKKVVKKSEPIKSNDIEKTKKVSPELEDKKVKMEAKKKKMLEQKNKDTQANEETDIVITKRKISVIDPVTGKRKSPEQIKKEKIAELKRRKAERLAAEKKRQAELANEEELDDVLPGVDETFEDTIIPREDDEKEINKSLPNVEDDFEEDTLPGLEDDFEDDTLPGLEDDFEEDGLPGLEDDFEEDGLPGLDDDFEEDGLPGLDDDFEEDELPGLDDDFEEDELPEIEENFEESDDTLPGFEDDEYTDEVSLPGLDELDELEEDSSMPKFDESEDEDDGLLAGYNYDEENSNNEIQSIKPKVDYSMSSLNSLLTKDKKIVTFLGTTKNGTSFLVNNLAALFSSVGINTAILDMTQNRNSYYIYTNNEEELRNIAYNSISKLQKGFAEGIAVNKNLTVYTALPNDGKKYEDAEPILSTLVQNHSLILIDCDFETAPAYFASCQEIYLVQSMDILTIQPLTAFLRDLKSKGVLESEKVRVVINKEIKVRSLTTKAIIGGMSFYNDPSMSFMTELFNKDMVKACSIPFEDNAYSKYLDAMVNCNLTLNGYSKTFMNKLKNLGDMVYPLVSKSNYGGGKTNNYDKKSSFSKNTDKTLKQMKNKY